MSWQREVIISDIVDNTTYFIAIKPKNNIQGYRYWSRNLNGKELWTVKPGIAIRAKGGDKLRELLANRPDCAALAIPADADTRWTARSRIRGSTSKKR